MISKRIYGLLFAMQIEDNDIFRNVSHNESKSKCVILSVCSDLTKLELNHFLLFSPRCTCPFHLMSLTLCTSQFEFYSGH